MDRPSVAMGFDPSECDDPSVLAREIRAALDNGDTELVEDALWRLIEIDPHPERAQMLLALRLVQQGHYEDSLRQIEEASAKLVLTLRTAVDGLEPDAFDPPAPQGPHRVWRMTDSRGSWVSLEVDTKASVRRWSYMELLATYPTYDEAVRALYAAEKELRESGRDRRKNGERRRNARSSRDRRGMTPNAVESHA